METLKKSDIIPYLGQELKVLLRSDYLRSDYRKKYEVVGIDLPASRVKLLSEDWTTKEADIEEVVPILRPVSDLKKEIRHKNERFIPSEKLKDWLTLTRGGSDGTVRIWHEELLFSWFFDVKGLIKKGLAVDINQVNILNQLQATTS